MTIERLGRPTQLDDERIKALKDLLPEAFADDQLNVGVLRDALAGFAEDEEAIQEHYGLTWPGKRHTRKLAVVLPSGTLAPMPGEGINEANTKNIVIEGDNLEVLRILQKSYVSRIKMIYIDPPYNTGQDFIYKDDFKEPVESYLRLTGQADEEGLLTSNPKASGRYHSNWLNMMYPRIRLARNLLNKEGFLIVSIDDNEVSNLRLMLDELFGAECFVACLVWKSRTSEDTRAKTGVSTDHEYILCYRKTEEGIFRGSEKDLSKFDNPDDDPRGPWRSADLTGLATKDARPNLHYNLIAPKTKVNYGCPPKGWRFAPDTMAKKIAEGRILFPENNKGRPRHKLFLNEMKSSFKNISSVISDISTADGTREVNEVLGSGIFSFPKPTALIKTLINQVCSDDDIVMDFFAGSGTTGHSVYSLNEEGDTSLRFICVQLPEKIVGNSSAQKMRLHTIADVTKARLKKASALFKKDKSGKDRGFKVFKLAKSNVKRWVPYDGKSADQLGSLFATHDDALFEGWIEDGVVYEIMLAEGYPLDSEIKLSTSFNDNKMWIITCAEISHTLHVCLDNTLAKSTLKLIGKMAGEDVLVCLEKALQDQAKLSIADSLNIKTL